MNIEDDLRQLSLQLAKLGLEQVVAEKTAASETFRVVYVNKNAKAQPVNEPNAASHKGNKNKTSSKL